MATTVTITTRTGVATYEVSTGARGPAGAAEELTDIAITTALQGAEADPTRIGAEYIPLVLPVDSIIISDSASSNGVPTSGELIRIGSALALGDGVSVGGNIIYDNDRIFGAGEALLADYTSTDIRKFLAAVPIPKRFAAVGAVVEIYGYLRIYTVSSLPMEFYTVVGFSTDAGKLIGDNPVGGIIGISLDGLKDQITFSGLKCSLVASAVSGDASKVKWTMLDNSSIRASIIDSSGVASGSGQLSFDDISGTNPHSCDVDQPFNLNLLMDIPAGSTMTAVQVIWDFSIRGINA